MVLLLAIATGLIVRFVLLRTLASVAVRLNDVIVSSIHKRIKKSWFLFMPLTLFLLLFPRSRFDASNLEIILNIIETLIIISFGVIAIRLVNVLQDVIVHKYDIGKPDNSRERRIRTQLAFIKKILNVIIVMFMIAFILLNIKSVRHYGAALVTSAGLAGIVLGFAAQKTLANILAGFQIAFTQPIKLDDAVLIEGEWGWIEEISLTYVVVKIWDLRRMVIPITYFIEKPFQNWTRVTADLIGSVFLYVDYSVPIESLRKAFDEIIASSTLWDQKIKVLQVTDSTEKSMELRLLMGARNSPEAWDLRCEVREKMISYIQQHHPESFPTLRTTFDDKAILYTNGARDQPGKELIAV